MMMEENESYQNLLDVANDIASSFSLSFLEYGKEDMDLNKEYREHYQQLFDKTKMEVEEILEKFGFEKQIDGYEIYEKDGITIIYHYQNEKPFSIILDDNNREAVLEARKTLTKLINEVLENL